MAAPAQQVPTFKLVLVGDGGTGKVSPSLSSSPEQEEAVGSLRLALAIAGQACTPPTAIPSLLNRPK